MSRIEQFALDLEEGTPRTIVLDSKTGKPPKPEKERQPEGVLKVTPETFTTRVRAARKLGEEGAARAQCKADRVCPGFSVRVALFISTFAHAQTHGTTFRGEDLVNQMKGSGIVPHDDRAFGSMFAKAIRDGYLTPVGSVARVKGHGAPGGQVYTRGPRA